MVSKGILSREEAQKIFNRVKKILVEELLGGGEKTIQVNTY